VNRRPGQDDGVRAAVVQVPASEDKPANLRRLQEQVRRAADLGAQLVVGPEAAMHDFGPPDLPLGPVAERLDGPFVTGVQEVAQQTGTTVLAGMFEAGEDDRVFNTVVAVDAAGAVLGTYRKVHLFDALGWVESDRFSPGDGTLLVLPLDGLTVGVQTCYDLRFPELSRALVDRGADVLALPAAWVAGPHKQQQWTTLVAARAIESTAYVVAACQSPPLYVGASRVVDPMGEVLAGVAGVEGIAVGDLTPERVAEVRTALPSLRHRRMGVPTPP
jgi:predicted amidohydrolase